MSGSLDRSRIMMLFGELSTALEEHGVRGHVYLVGGSALIAGYGRTRTTRDVDGRIDYARDEVIAAVRRVGRRNGVGDDWLNERATVFLPRTPDERAKTVYNSPGLVVTGASAEHLLAMKMFAGRESDREDIKHLIGVLGIRQPNAAVRIYEQVYAGWQLPQGTREKVEHAVADAREERGEPVPALKLEDGTTLRAQGGGSRTYEATAEERSGGGQTFRVTVRDPDAVDDEQERGSMLYGEPHPIRTVEAANAAVDAYERHARARAGQAPSGAVLELQAVEMLRAEGERGRRYRAEWMPARRGTERLHVTVTDPAIPDEEYRGRERVLLRTGGDGLVRNVDEANEVINRYERAAAGRR